MAYLERTVERRLNPELVLPGAQSILLLAISYHRPGSGGAVASGEGSGCGVWLRATRVIGTITTCWGRR
jgi:hypothetical protein